MYIHLQCNFKNWHRDDIKQKPLFKVVTIDILRVLNFDAECSEQFIYCCTTHSHIFTISARRID